MKYITLSAALMSLIFLFFSMAHAIPPIADAGPDQVVFHSVTIDGSNSHDPDEDIVSFHWTIHNRFTGIVSFASGGPIISLDNMDPGLYEITLLVTDNQNDTHSDMAIIGVAGPCGLNSTCPGDSDNDGDVDSKDLKVFASKYGCSNCFNQDTDEDGFIAFDDCNDRAPGIFPGAQELCDNKDNDCDGLIDEDFVCGIVCPPGQTKCNETCVDLQNDESNCGGCGLQCPAGHICSNGTCL